MRAVAVSDNGTQPGRVADRRRPTAHYLRQDHRRVNQRIKRRRGERGFPAAMQSPDQEVVGDGSEAVEGSRCDVVSVCGGPSERDYQQSRECVMKRRVSVLKGDAAVPEREPSEGKAVLRDV